MKYEPIALNLCAGGRLALSGASQQSGWQACWTPAKLCQMLFLLRKGCVQIWRTSRERGFVRRRPLSLLPWVVVSLVLAVSGRAATLSGSYADVPGGSTVDLTAIGTIDWVHWGLLSDNTVVRKAGVSPQIGALTTVGSHVLAFRFFDNLNGYSWTDGWPVPVVMDTTTGLWAFGNRQLGSGFELRLPADATTRVAKVYVGVFAGVGEFSATLSDTNVAAYSDVTLTNTANGPGRVYTLEYTGNSEGEALVVRWTLAAAYDDVANVTFQAVALASATANNPPVVSLKSPADNSPVAAESTLTLTADAFDVDGQIEKVEFWNGEQKLGEDFEAPYSFEWIGVHVGHHILTATALDTAGAQRRSAPVEIFAHTTGGRLTGISEIPTRMVDLSSEGTLDWAHWGYPSNATFNHKAGVESQVSDIIGLGSSSFEQYSNNYTGFSWTDGTPITNAINTTSGLFIVGLTNGFELKIVAGTTLRRVRVYAGLYGAQGKFQAFLSDFSAPPYIDTTAVNMFGDRYNVYTIDFMAASTGQVLIVRYRPLFLFDAEFGNVTLQATTLQSLGPLLSYQVAGPDLNLAFGTEIGKTYALEFTESMDSQAWVSVTNVIGTGGLIPIVEKIGPGQGFYRVRTEASALTQWER